ncbi:MAG: hypothetical protein NUV81_02635, partial [bacterium]|nr:hypothetical protein [bacterium]
MPERIPKTIYTEPVKPPLESVKPLLEVSVDAESIEQKERERVIEAVIQEAGIRVRMSVHKGWIGRESKGSGFQDLETKPEGSHYYSTPSIGHVAQAVDPQMKWDSDLGELAESSGIHEFLRVGYGSDQNGVAMYGKNDAMVRFDYFVADKKWRDYSGRAGQLLSSDMVLPESVAKELLLQLEKDPTVYREIIGRFMKEKLLTEEPDAWDKSHGVGDPLRPRYETWDPDGVGKGMKIMEDPEVLAWSVEEVVENSPDAGEQFAKDLAKEQGAGLDEVRQIEVSAQQDVGDDLVARKAIKESTDISERAIAEATRHAREDAKRRVEQKVRMDQSFFESYVPQSPPLLEILKNTTDVGNDNDRRELKRTIAENEEQIKEMERLADEGAYFDEQKECERTVLMREQALNKHLLKKDMVARENENLIHRLEEINSELQEKKEALEALQVKDVLDPSDDEKIATLIKDREWLAKKRAYAVRGIEAGNDELFVIGLALASMDRLLTKSKDELNEIREWNREQESMGEIVSKPDKGRETGKKEERETKNNEDQKAKIVREDKTSVVR